MEGNLYINYIIFTIMYATSIFFSYKEYTESIAILALFVVNTSFLMYMSKDIFYHMTSKGISTTMLQYTIIFSILGSLLINSCALFLENLSLMTISRFSRFNKLASSVASTMKPFSLPNCSLATIPAGMDLCQNPSVFENHNTLNHCENKDVPRIVNSKQKLHKRLSNFIIITIEYKLFLW